MPTDVILDVDTGVDDALALLFAPTSSPPPASTATSPSIKLSPTPSTSSLLLGEKISPSPPA